VLRSQGHWCDLSRRTCKYYSVIMGYTVDIRHRLQQSVLLRTTDISSRRVKGKEYFVVFFVALLALQAKK
jgi:hypothetical protein